MPAYLQALAANHNSLGVFLDDLGKREEARAEYKAARGIQAKLVEQFPAVPEYRRELALTRNNLGNLLQVLGEREKARAEHQAARDIWKKLVEQFPTVPEYRIDLGGSYCNYGSLIRTEGKAAESLPWFDLAVRTLKPVLDRARATGPPNGTCGIVTGAGQRPSTNSTSLPMRSRTGTGPWNSVRRPSDRNFVRAAPPPNFRLTCWRTSRGPNRRSSHDGRDSIPPFDAMRVCDDFKKRIDGLEKQRAKP